jgi:ABC-type proline/glycine betaine transport system permease subunit
MQWPPPDNQGRLAHWPIGKREHGRMRQVGRHFCIVVVALLALASGAGNAAFLAQAPNNQRKFEEAIRWTQQIETLAYILAVAGILLVVASIPIAIYLDRKKKARKRTGQQGADRA